MIQIQRRRDDGAFELFVSANQFLSE